MRKIYGGVAQLVRALPWHGRGRRFEPSRVHQKKKTVVRRFSFFLVIFTHSRVLVGWELFCESKTLYLTKQRIRYTRWQRTTLITSRRRTAKGASPLASLKNMDTSLNRRVHIFYHCKFFKAYAFIASSIATAQATVIPTMGLLPAPIKPIISTWAGTDDEPANCASECILPIVSVIP